MPFCGRPDPRPGARQGFFFYPEPERKRDDILTYKSENPAPYGLGPGLVAFMGLDRFSFYLLQSACDPKT